MRLENRICIITGAASGIGRAAALQFAAEGATVAAIDRNQIELASELMTGYTADLTHEADVQRVIEEIVQVHGRIDSLFNVVGGSGRRMGDGPLDQISLEGWHYTLNLNLTTMFLMCKHALPHMGKGSSIINLSSILGMVGHPAFATHAYAASKGAIISMSRAMAVYYAEQGIRVNVIAPGLIATGMSQRAQQDESIINLMSTLQRLTGSIGQPEDIASVAVFLASDEARFLTGVVIPVDGGWTSQ